MGDLTCATPAGGSGDITDVGPGCSTGPCLTNGATTTGTNLFVWEGSTDDGFQITFQTTGDPTTSTTFEFLADDDLEWNLTDHNFRFGDADEGIMRFGNAFYGLASSTVGTTSLNHIVLSVNSSPTLPEGISYMWVGPNLVPRFVLSDEEINHASYDPESLLIGPPSTLVNVDENILCSTNFNNIDCDAAGSGADLGVQDDVEIGGDLFLSFDCTGNTNGGALTIATTTGLVSCSDDDGGSGDITDVFDCASGDCSSIAASDGDLLDFSAVDSSTTTEGLIIPGNSDCSTAGGTADGQLCWDTDTSTSTPGLYIGDGISTTTRRITQPFYTIIFVAGRAGANQWANMPASSTRIFADRIYVFSDLTGYEEYRIQGSMGILCAAGGDLNLQFASIGTAVPVEGDFNNIHAGSEGEAICDTQTFIGEFTSLLSIAQISGIWLRLVGKDGDGATDPQFTSIRVDFR